MGARAAGLFLDSIRWLLLSVRVNGDINFSANRLLNFRVEKNDARFSQVLETLEETINTRKIHDTFRAIHPANELSKLLICRRGR